MFKGDVGDRWFGMLAGALSAFHCYFTVKQKQHDCFTVSKCDFICKGQVAFALILSYKSSFAGQYA